MRRRKGSEKGARAIAVYLFYRSGEPLVALAAGRNLPIEAETLEGLLSVVGNFVETSMPGSRGYASTAMRYEEFGIVGIRGEFVIGAALFANDPAGYFHFSLVSGLGSPTQVYFLPIRLDSAGPRARLGGSTLASGKCTSS